ncbi:hypothetical protein OH76DRAFT_1402683 [Lentinus brumalis]|uniref:Uncharacterized protein n=1 Tax=Lentinus brumalis TaxID=2498619 RepID=A0A371DCE6_9APHY|nr:hypothetical protein OH76DRAFT_1402683 [Polyporus brumalis]
MPLVASLHALSSRLSPTTCLGRIWLPSMCHALAHANRSTSTASTPIVCISRPPVWILSSYQFFWLQVSYWLRQAGPPPSRGRHAHWALSRSRSPVPHSLLSPATLSYELSAASPRSGPL